MYSDENKSSILAKQMNGFDYVIIDTCSLMENGFPEWMDALHNAKDYRKKGQQILVPRRCYDELKKHAAQEKDDSRRIDAIRGLKILKRDQWWTHLLTITKKDKNENFADNAIFVRVSQDRLFKKILIITQDKSLASDLRALNDLKSQSGRPLEVLKIDGNGKLVPNLGETRFPKERKGFGALKETPKQTKPTSGVAEVLEADQRLSAVLGNPNYPEEKKHNDAMVQLRAIEKIPENTRNQLSLLVPEARLRELTKPQPKPAPVKEAKPKPTEKPKEEPKPAAKKTEEKNRLWYESGKTPEEAFNKTAEHYGILFREKGVAYVAEAHGPVDWTVEDLTAISELSEKALTGNEKATFEYQGAQLALQKVNDLYRAWIDVNTLPAPKPKKPTRAKKAEEKPVEPQEAAPAKPAKKAVKKPAENKAETKPVEEAEKPAKKPASKKKTPQKAEEKPENAETKKPAEPVAEKKKAAAKKPAQPKAEEQPKKAEPAKKKAAQPAKAKKVEKTPYETAKLADRRLSAVLPNPNYPLEDKIADIKAQRELLFQLTSDELGTLKYGPKEIEAWLQANAGTAA